MRRACCWLLSHSSCPIRSAARARGSTLQRLRLHEHVGPSREDYIDLMVNSSYTYSVFGITFSSFALAGLVYWSPTFLTVAKGLTEAQAESPAGIDLLRRGDPGHGRGRLARRPGDKDQTAGAFYCAGSGYDRRDSRSRWRRSTGAAFPGSLADCSSPKARCS